MDDVSKVIPTVCVVALPFLTFWLFRLTRGRATELAPMGMPMAALGVVTLTTATALTAFSVLNYPLEHLDAFDAIAAASLGVCVAIVMREVFTGLTDHADSTSARAFVFAAAVNFIVIVLIFFAAVYRNFGIIGTDNVLVRDQADCIYFSIVTFTTLGYGDFRPSPDARLWAAAESLVGYLMLAGSITIFGRVMAPARRR